MESKLYLFTGRFPYSKVENFLEDEIIYLCREFDKVFIIPFKSETGPRRICPDNCITLEPIVKSNWDYILKGLFNLRGSSVMFKDLLKNRALFSLKKLKVWGTGYIAVNCLLNSSVIREISEKMNGQELFYFYWGKWGNVLSYFYKKKSHYISRFHGDWDLWEERYDGYAPLRKQVSSSLDCAVFISQKGQDYFRQRYPECNTRLFRLGTKDIGVVPYSKDGVIRVLSCSTVYPLKRVDLILDSVVEMSKTRKVEWTHLGGGVDFDRIKAVALSKQNESLSINMSGMISYSEVLDYYKNHCVDVFVNLSTNEGIPVSIMEAISCDIPVVATNVGSTSEVVREESGLLVSSNPTPSEVASTISRVVDNRNSFSPRAFWASMYMADTNYKEFSFFLKKIVQKYDTPVS